MTNVVSWVVDNTSRGNRTEVTSSCPRASFELKTLDYMSSNRNLYDAFKDNDELFEDVKKLEVGYRSHRFPMLKQTTLVYKDVKSAFKDGDIIAITTKTTIETAIYPSSVFSSLLRAILFINPFDPIRFKINIITPIPV